ncbi:MAG: transposase [Euryarchaeota archaeon]|nr:transposase [Euryarchaeota archaeon]
MNDIGVLPDFDGTAIHDHCSSCYKFDCKHAECNAHILRELKFLHEENGQAWAKSMSTHLIRAKTCREESIVRGTVNMDNNLLNEIELQFDKIFRMEKVRQKISGTIRGKKSCREIANIRRAIYPRATS